MDSIPMVYVTETTFAVGNGDRFFNTPEQKEILEWCDQHGINGEALPLDNEIVRDVDAKTVAFTSVEPSPGSQAFTHGDQVHYRTVKQLDEPPAPWPDAVAAHIGEIWLGESEHDKQVKAQALLEAADAIQALHPGETKASVQFLRDRAEEISND